MLLGADWITLEPLGILFKILLGAAWNCLEPLGSAWSGLEQLGAAWSHSLEPLEIIFNSLTPSIFNVILHS